MGGVIMKIEGKCAGSLVGRARINGGAGMWRFQVNPASAAQQTGNLTNQMIVVVEMLHELHARNGIHGAIGPGQPVALQVNAVEFAGHASGSRRPAQIDRAQPKIRTELAKVTQGFAIGSAEVQQGASVRHARHKVRSGIQPRRISQ
jgi:hypothetical protein